MRGDPSELVSLLREIANGSDADSKVRLLFNGAADRIEGLEADVERAKSRSNANWNLACKAKAKLAAMEGAPRHTHIAPEAEGDFEYVKWANLQAILRGEGT